VYTEKSLEEANAMFQRIENGTRKEMLSYIYKSPRTYSDLIAQTGLKPGSLYHHLKILNGLVEKREHGLYAISLLGQQIVEALELTKDTRPSILPEVKSEDNLSTDANKTEIFDNAVVTSLPTVERLDQVLWLGIPNVFIILLVITVVIYMGFQDVVIAGSALYAVYGPNPFFFDVTAILLGWFSLYTLEKWILSSTPYHAILYAFVIRIMMMLPAVIVGIALSLIFISGSAISPVAFQILFAITITLGYVVAVNGLQYLRGVDRSRAINLALVPSIIDLLLGIVIFISQ